MSGHSFTSDNNDEPFYFTPTYKSEDLICEGSDTEADPRAIIEKRRQYEECADRIARGKLPIIQSALLRGPLDKENGWVNPWRHREGDWWKPGSKDMLFRREDVMRRAREHGRKDMSPGEALAWCRRDAKRQAKEMGIDNYTDMEHESATRSTRLVVDETIHGDLTLKQESGSFKRHRSLIVPPLPQVSESLLPTHANTEGFKDISIFKSSISNKEGYIEEPEAWTGAKRPIDAVWLKGSHASKRARWEDPAVSSPTPLPHASSHKVQQKLAGTAIVAQNRTSHMIQPRLGRSLETLRQELSPQKSHASLQPPDTAFDTEISFHTNIGQQGQQQLSSSAFESSSKLAYLHEKSPEPYPPVPFDTLASRKARAPQPSVTKPVTSPRLPSHPRIGALHDESHETPGNVSFVTDVAPSSVNLEHFEFRKKRRRKTNSPEVTNKPSPIAVKGNQASLSEGSRLNPTLYSDAILSTPFISHPTEKIEGSSVSSTRRTKSARSKGSSRRSSRVDESWLSTQEEVGITPSVMDFDSQRTIKGDYTPQYENIDNSWVTTQDDFNHAPKSSASMDITQIYRSSNFLRRPNLAQLAEAPPAFVNYNHRSDLQQSPSVQSSSTLFVPSPEKSSQHLPVLLKDDNKLDVPIPYNNLAGSSTQSYNTSPVGSIESKLKSSQAPPFSNIENGNPESATVHVQISDDSKEVEIDIVKSQINVALENEQTEEVSVLQANQEANIDIELQPELTASKTLQNAEDLQGVAQERMQKEVEDTMRAEPDADDAFNSALASGHTSTSSSPAITNNLTMHDYTSIHKSRSGSQILKSSMSNQITPSLPSEEEIIPPASTQDLTEYLLVAAAAEETAAITSGGTESIKTSNLDLQAKEEATTRQQSEEEAATENSSPQSPWAPAEAVLMVAPRILTTTEIAEPNSNPDSSNSGWQKEERPGTPDNDIIRPFSDLMTPSPPPEEINTPEVDSGPSNTQLLVEAATQNPWVNGSKRKSTKRKRVSFGLLDDEDPSQSEPSPQRQRRSPSPEYDAFKDNVARFDDDITDMNSFQNHFSTIRRKSGGDDVPKIDRSVKRPSSIAKYKTTLSSAINPIASSPATDAMAEAFIAADRNSSREREGHLTVSPSPNRKSKRQSHTTFEDEDKDESDIHPLNFNFSTNIPLNETSSNAKLGNHTPEDYLDELEDFLGESWSVEGELKKATGMDFELSTPKRNNGVHSRRSLLSLENAWT